MSTPEDLMVDAIAEVAYERHEALHVDAGAPEPTECRYCKEDEVMSAVRRWAFTVYHDEDGEAAVDSEGHGPFESQAEAVAAATAKIDGYWQSATVEVGDWHPGVYGESPPYWDERVTIAYIYAGLIDWIGGASGHQRA